MKKVTAVIVAVGVILVIAGLVMVGIFGGEKLRNTNWKDVFSGTMHDLNSVNGGVDKTAEELEGLTSINVNARKYSVYVLPSQDDTFSVKYVEPLQDEASVSVNYVSGVLTVTQTDSIDFLWFGGLLSRNRFFVVYVPQTELFTNASLTVNAETASIKVQDVTFAEVKNVVKTGSVNLQDIKTDDLYVETTTGSVNVNGVKCGGLVALTNTGSININETDAVNKVTITTNTGSVNCHLTTYHFAVTVNTGSVNFDVTADDIRIETDTGSVNGTVNGIKSEYDIKVRKDTGRSNISSQSVPNATKFLNIEVDTGSINVHFKND